MGHFVILLTLYRFAHKPEPRYALPMTKTPPILSSLCAQLLVATPQMTDSRFHRSVIYMCQHDADSAMGLIINQRLEDLHFGDLAAKLELGTPRDNAGRPIYTGGPVEPRRGYILHSQDQTMPDTVSISEDVALSLHIDMLKDIASGLGPERVKIMLGYTSWSAGQLEDEMRQNMWFHIPASADLIFAESIENIWAMSFDLAGLNAGSLSPQTGSA